MAAIFICVLSLETPCKSFLEIGYVNYNATRFQVISYKDHDM